MFTPAQQMLLKILLQREIDRLVAMPIEERDILRLIIARESLANLRNLNPANPRTNA
jgi:hypothetical protein